MPEKNRGGKREGAGRKKSERLTDTKVATRVLAQVRVEQLWLKIIHLEVAKIDADPIKASTGQLRETLKYLENRSLGNCVDTVNHMHDKPIDLNVTVSLADTIEKARKRVKA